MKQIINLGANAGDKTGTKARPAGRIINENFTEVYDTIDLLIADSTIYNKVLVSTGFSLAGQDLTINAAWQWIIGNVAKTNPANVVINIPFAATGKSRIEYVVPNDANGFTRVIGVESTTIPVAPQLPNKDMFATWFIVDDGSIGTPSPPVLGDNFISKREKAPFQVYNSGEIDNVVLDEFFYGYLNFRDAVTNLKSIGTYTNAYLYSGRELLIKNSQATDITIYHLTGSGFQFSFPNEVNFVLKPNEIIRFSTKILSPTSGILEYVGVVRNQISDVVGLVEALTLKVDKDGTKVLSDNNYTTSEKNKLVSIDATHYLPPLQTTVQLSALPQATVSDKARVYVENDLADYFYDATAASGDIAPDDQAGGIGFWRKVAVGGETAASIKTKYESNPDTNAFTDAEQALVATISGKEASSNKTDIVTGNETSSLLFASIKGMFDWCVGRFQPKLVAGSNITIDNTNPLAPVISASGGGGSSLPTPIADTASIPFTAMLTTIADHTMSGALTIIPNVTGAISGCGAIQQIIADGINVPDLTAFKTLSTSDVYLNIYGKINILVYFFDGSNYNVAIVQNGASVPVNPTSLVGEWKSRLSAAGYSLSSPRETAYIDFITAIASAGVYDLITEMWLHEGGLAATNVIGFKNAKTLIPNGGITYASTGSTGNGTTGYFNVGYSPSNLDVRDMHMCVYGRSDAANNGYIIGAETNPAYTYLAPRSTILYAGIGSVQYNPTNPATSGRYIISRLAGAIHIRRNGTLNSSTGTNTTDTSTLNLYLLAHHSSGGATSFSNQEIGFTSVGKALTTTQSAAFDAALATLFTALSR